MLSESYITSTEREAVRIYSSFFFKRNENYTGRCNAIKTQNSSCLLNQLTWADNSPSAFIRGSVRQMNPQFVSTCASYIPRLAHTVPRLHPNPGVRFFNFFPNRNDTNLLGKISNFPASNANINSGATPTRIPDRTTQIQHVMFPYYALQL
jgi:hypothetical protein